MDFRKRDIIAVLVIHLPRATVALAVATWSTNTPAPVDMYISTVARRVRRPLVQLLAHTKHFRICHRIPTPTTRRMYRRQIDAIRNNRRHQVFNTKHAQVTHDRILSRGLTMHMHHTMLLLETIVPHALRELPLTAQKYVGNTFKRVPQVTVLLL